MKKAAFTLLEVIVVITVIMILVGVMIIDFNGARRQQELDMGVQQVLAMMDQSRAQVDSGKVLDDGETYLCRGAYFEVGSMPLLAETLYDPVLENCDLDTAVTQNYGLQQGSLTVNSIQLDQEHKAIWALFVPPEADLIFFEDSGSSFVGDGTMDLGHLVDEELSRQLNFSSVNSRVTLSSNSDDEN